MNDTLIENIDISALPDSLVEIVEVIGLEAALNLVEAFGGTSVWIPKDIPEGHPLVNEIGRHKADLLASQYSLIKLSIPKASKAICAARDQLIFSQRGSKTVNQLALEHNLSTRRVQQIFKSFQ